MPKTYKISKEKAAEIKEIRKYIKDKKQIKDYMRYNYVEKGFQTKK